MTIIELPLRSCRLLVLVAAAVVAALSDAEAAEVWIAAPAQSHDTAGVYHLTLDEDEGKLGRARLVDQVDRPGFLAKHPTLPVLYATGGVDGEPSIVAYRVESTEVGPTLARIAVQPTDAGGATHITVDQTARVLLAAFYGAGKVASYPLDEQGRLLNGRGPILHRGGSRVVPGRQNAPHPHWAGVTPDNRFALVPDLGLDQIVIYRLNPKTATLTPHGSVATPAGGGPRHLAFHPGGRWAYVVNELTMSLTALQYDASAGTLEPIQTIATLSEEQIAGEAFNSGSEVRVHPSGKFAYSANRGHDSITAFAIDQATGELSLIEQEPIRGSWPRHFTIDPSGRWLLAAGRDTNSLTVFQIDSESGELQYTLNAASMPRPICVLVDGGSDDSGK